MALLRGMLVCCMGWVLRMDKLLIEQKKKNKNIDKKKTLCFSLGGVMPRSSSCTIQA